MKRKDWNKVPLFDRIFKPKTYTLPNGHTVKKPRSRTPLILCVLAIIIFLSIQLTGFDLGIIAKRGNQLTKILSQIFTPDFSFVPKVWSPLLDTLKMSIVGSFIGATLALPFAVAASTNISKNRWLIMILRFLLNVIRTLPTLVVAKVFALIFGLGTFAGTMAIFVFTFGVISKMMYESIETIDMGAFDAMESCGATKVRAFWSACMKQILPTYLSYCLYALEMNVRAASILGYVGAGGLGLLIDERIGWRDYKSLGALLLILFLVVMLIENISQYLRKKLS